MEDLKYKIRDLYASKTNPEMIQQYTRLISFIDTSIAEAVGSEDPVKVLISKMLHMRDFFSRSASEPGLRSYLYQEVVSLIDANKLENKKKPNQSSEETSRSQEKELEKDQLTS
jgi:hypothetical protein